MVTQNIAVINLSNSFPSAQVNVIVAALQKQVATHFSPIWGVSAVVSCFSTLDDKPPDYWPICIVDQLSNPNLAGYHTTADNLPYSLVLSDGPVSLDISHECLEMLADPFGSATRSAPSLITAQGIVRYLVEVCDPCEKSACAYSIDSIQVCDFCTPDYYVANQTSRAKFSYQGSLTAPLQVLDGGYITWFDDATNIIWQGINTGGEMQFLQISSADLGTLNLREISDRHSHGWFSKKNEERTNSKSGQTASSAEEGLRRRPYGAHADRIRAEIARFIRSEQLQA